MGMDYQSFLKSKAHPDALFGFKPLWLPDWLFAFQRHLVEWAVRKGRCALYEDCGLGKGPQQLVWAENMVRKTKMPVLILAPLAVSAQFVREGEKFGITVHRTRDGKVHKGINVTNYEQMDKYNPGDFGAVSGDESGCIKHHDSKTRKRVVQFFNKVQYRLLCTATPAPNDYMELGSSAEALGVMTSSRMLGTFFTHDTEDTQQWSLKGHAAKRFWKWVCTWARAVRKPSDLGFSDAGFILPKLTVNKHELTRPWTGGGFAQLLGARTLTKQRQEKKKSTQERCGKVAELVRQNGGSSVVWCHHNDEGDLLEELIPGAVQVSGGDSDRVKEDRFMAFAEGDFPVLVTKPKIGGWGLNWQHCNHMTWFVSHSFEAYYQAVRRCWRFGQKRPVTVDMVLSQGERQVIANLSRKERQAEAMFSSLVASMAEHQNPKKQSTNGQMTMEIPAWLNGGGG